MQGVHKLSSKRSEKTQFFQQEGAILLKETEQLAPILAQEILSVFLSEHDVQKKFYDSKSPFTRIFNLSIHEPCEELNNALAKLKLISSESVIEQWCSIKKISMIKGEKPKTCRYESNLNTNWTKYWIDRLCDLTIESIQSQLMIEHPKQTFVDFLKIGHETSTSFSSISYDKLGCQIAIKTGDTAKDPTLDIFNAIVHNQNSNLNETNTDLGESQTKSRTRSVFGGIFSPW